MRGGAAAAAVHHLDEVRDLHAQPFLQPRQLLLGLTRTFAAEHTVARELERFCAALCRLHAADHQHDACVREERRKGRCEGEGEGQVKQLQCGRAEIGEEAEEDPDRMPGAGEW